jgi:hypothetical protein
MLSQISSSKTQDVGKLSVVLVEGNPLLINLCDELGADSQNRPEFLARAKNDYLSSDTSITRGNMPPPYPYINALSP